MTSVVEPSVSKARSAEDGTGQDVTTGNQDSIMEDIKSDEPSDIVTKNAAAVINNDVAPSNDANADNDSEAETLIVSPEKRRALAEGATSPRSARRSNLKEEAKSVQADPENDKKTRKRKRAGDGQQDQASNNHSQPSSAPSSPLSSPAIAAHSRDSDSDVSTRSGLRSARSQRTRRNGANLESEGAETNAPPKTRRRRPSDIMPPAKHRSKGSIDAGGSERRETRSATYPRQSSEEGSPSPGPSSRREHRRGVSTQFISGDLNRKKRGRPPAISTRRNRSADRTRSSSEESSSPHQRPSLQKFSSHDHDAMSPAKASGPRKWRDKNGRTFLSRASNNDDLERVKTCYYERPEDLNLPDNAGNSPLQIAALEGYVDIVKFLLEKGADVDTRNIDKETPLIDAVENGHLEVVKLLLEHGANPRLGNAKGDEPYELVDQNDENYKIIRRLIADAKDQDATKRRRSGDNSKDEERERGSSRAASAASPRDSPPVLGPRSPPALSSSSRRRTGRSESTRNDLLWQHNTPENLRVLAAKGNVQGVIYVLNILGKAEPDALIAAAKAGHEEVLQYLLAMGDADPDPDPIPELKPGFNTPILAAIGRGHLDVVKLLVEQGGFNPTKKWKGKTYYEIAADRKGDNWQKEQEILKTAYEKYASGKPRKTSSPRKTRDQDRPPKEKKIRRSISPTSSTVHQSSSPSLTHKSLPEKSPKTVLRERKREVASPQQQERRKASATAKEGSDSVAVASDQEKTVGDKKAHKHRRSQSDLPVPVNLESESAHRRRRLVSGKEHRRRKSAATGGEGSEDIEIEVEVKRENTPNLKRTRSSVSPHSTESNAGEKDRLVVKKRRTVLENSPEESRLSLKQDSKANDVEMKDASSDANVLDQVNAIFRKHSKSKSPAPATSTATGTADKESPAAVETSSTKHTSKPDSRAPTPAKYPADEVAIEAERQKREEETKAAEEANRLEQERLAAQKLEEEKIAAEKAAREAEAAEKAAAEKRAAEEAEAKRKAEEEAMARKKEEEERQERIRRELEDTKRRQEEQIRQQHLEIERRRREALPAGLAKCSLLLDNSDPSYTQWLTRFLPLFTVRTEQLDPNCPPGVADELWVPNWQVAVLLGTKDLNLRNYTALDKREATTNHRDRMWRVGRFMLSYNYWTNGYNTSVKQANEIERQERPKFFAMTELFWVKVSIILCSLRLHDLTRSQLSDFEDQVIRHPHLNGLERKQRSISLRPQNEIIAQGEAKELSKQPNGIPPPTAPLTNGIYTTPPLRMNRMPAFLD
jgi:ankyrin repeat protein